MVGNRWATPQKATRIAPAKSKMMDPRYRDVKADTIPEVTIDNDVKIKIICGEVDGTKGPVQDIVVDTEYLDVTIPANNKFEREFKNGYKVFAYVINGSGYFEPKNNEKIAAEHLVIFDDGESIEIKTPDQALRFLLISGKPLDEPVAWYGPIVMNTDKELELAFKEYEKGTFIKKK